MKTKNLAPRTYFQATHDESGPDHIITLHQDGAGKDHVLTVVDWHSFNDFGQSLETVTVRKDEIKFEIYSQDEGDTFTFDIE